VIKQFAYTRASSSEDAGRQLAVAEAPPLGGGTDLLVCIREELTHPDTVVDPDANPRRNHRRLARSPTRRRGEVAMGIC